MEVEIGMMQLQGKECRETDAFATQEHGAGPPQGLWREAGPANTLTSDSSLRTGENTVLF